MTDDHNRDTASKAIDDHALEKTYEEAADDLVRSGRFATREDVLREGGRLVEWRELRRAERDAALARGLAQAEAGLGTPLEEVLADFEGRHKALAERRKA
ncbi:MAG: type II toxin-antitoxin system ParD family antitoxin [Neorhizobium sp.]|nr:type II toxin-antitoxin system ParD family antitoxin [Neorhizobium sp.]